MTYQTDTAISAISLGDRIAAFREEITDKLAKRKVYRATFSELAALSDRDLNDLNISRAMIRQIARDAAGIA